MTEKLRMPEIQPPHPTDKFTFEEALVAAQAVADEQRRQVLRKQARKARKLAPAAGGGEDP